MSVAATREIVPALRGGAQILDVKDPRRGSLGPADPDVVRRARHAAPAGVPVTAALGDGPWRDGDEAAAAALAAQLLEAGASLLKVGLAGLSPGEVSARLLALRRRIESLTGKPAGLVAVGFADDPGAEPVAGRWLAAAAADAGLAGAMLDTLAKGRSLLARCGVAELRGWADGVRSRDLLCGVAGSLALAELPRAAEVGSDVVGLRGAVCVGGRDGRVSARLVKRARVALHGAAIPVSRGGRTAGDVRRAWS